VSSSHWKGFELTVGDRWGRPNKLGVVIGSHPDICLPARRSRRTFENSPKNGADRYAGECD